jgi:imidazolonepropionase-like amidohydrolase
LLPGLIDAHTHIQSADQLRQALMFGVTTELDMFSAHALAAHLRNEQAAGAASHRADLLSAGTLVTAPGGHGTEYGMVIPTLEGPGEAQAFVDARLAEGSDYIKIVYDHLRPSAKTLTRESLAAVVAAAHARGKLAVVHIGTVEDARDAFASGADGLAHLSLDRPMDEAVVRLAARRRAFVVPTLSVLESVTGVAGGAALAETPEMARVLASGSVDYLKRAFPVRPGSRLSYAHAAESVRRLKAAGVPILAGTDAPNPGTVHGASLHREMELLVRAGLRPVEALAAATSIPAARFGLKDRGVVAAGKRADLLLVQGDPTRDIRATRRIVGIWKEGVAVDRDAYAAEIGAGAE